MKKMKSILCGVLAVVLLLGLVGCSAQTKWQKEYDLGIRYLSEGNYQEAIIRLTAAIEIDPNNKEAYLARAQAYVSSEGGDNLRLAMQDYESVRQLGGETEELCYTLLDIQRELGDEGSLIHLLRYIADTYGASEAFMELFIELSYEIGDTDAVLELLAYLAENYGASDALVNRLAELGYELAEDGTLREIDWNGKYWQISEGMRELRMDFYYGGSEQQQAVRSAISFLQAYAEKFPEEKIGTLRLMADAYYSLGELDACLETRAELYAEAGWDNYNPEGYVEHHTTYSNYYNGYGRKVRYEGHPVDYVIGMTDVETVTSYGEYEYDSMGRLVKETFNSESSMSGNTPGRTVTYEYDAQGRIAKKTEESFTSTYHWNGEWEYTPETYVNEYSYDGNMARYDRYHDGELMSWTIVELNEYGGRVHQQGYDSDGTPSPWGSF